MIDAEVEVAADTVIEPFVQLLGRTRIGAGCLIRSYSVIENCTLGDDVLVRQSCVLAESTVADGAKIGPFAHLRPGSEIGEDAHVGNFVETKKAKLGKGAKANHLTYLGDAEVGERTNIGAGPSPATTTAFTSTHPHRQGRLCRQRLHAGGAGDGGRRRLHRRRLLHHHRTCPKARWPLAALARSSRRAGRPPSAPAGKRDRQSFAPIAMPFR